jgi:phenylpyruvate tautomerase PptA (4-oxalocrotonate tautomerase family)
VRSIGGLNGAVNAALSKSICDKLSEELGISGDRVYINFIDVSADSWGWNGGTFG